jgi:glycosyltransferase involved in cell wall biosynthesis
VTNHNNARSCWELLEEGIDVLPGAEFTCRFPEYDLHVHVLCYGFTPAQEGELLARRKNIYQFLDCARASDLPCILPHPLYLDPRRKLPGLELFEKLALLFNHFEVLNGQRDVWQNLLTATWLRQVDDERLAHWSRKHDIPLDRYNCRANKSMTGGSDDHCGIFAGTSGTFLRVPRLAERRKKEAMSLLALEGLRLGVSAPYGTTSVEEKLNLAFLGYFCQLASHIEDPGLIRMFLHRGTLKDKLSCLAIGNTLLELRRHKFTMRFIDAFQRAVAGKKPAWSSRLAVPKDYRPLLKTAVDLARTRKHAPWEMGLVFRRGLQESFTHLNRLMGKRLRKKASQFREHHQTTKQSFHDLLNGLEFPLQVRSLFQSQEGKGRSQTSLGAWLDQISAPFLISAMLAASRFAATRVLFRSRPFLESFAEHLGLHRHPRRLLWLTDSLEDRNGVSTALQAMLAYVRERDLPIDFLVCDDFDLSDNHLHRVKAIECFSISQLSEQPIRVPDLMAIQEIFQHGGYDRILCSTELLMGPVALFLKAAFCVPAHFFMHTDWLLRFFYRQFDGVFVLNSEHREWLSGPTMGLDPAAVQQTAHWVSCQAPADGLFEELMANKARCGEPKKLLFAGRLSEEKGVGELVEVLRVLRDSQLRDSQPGIQMEFAGTGPLEGRLQELLPEAVFHGWVSQDRLVELYCQADLFVFPSTFDTFGCSVLEALACGLPVVAYDRKGPRDMITAECGYLVRNRRELIAAIERHLALPDPLPMRRAARARAAQYSRETIMAELMAKLGLPSTARNDSPLEAAEHAAPQLVQA